MIDEQVDYSALQAAQRVDAHMRLHYRVRLADLEQTDTPGYWQDKEPKMHTGHPLHSCLFFSGPFRATYTFFDHPRINGRFASRTRTWAELKKNPVNMDKLDEQRNRVAV